MGVVVDDPVTRMQQLYNELLAHDGYGDMRVEVRIMRRGQKEVIIHCGKQYRYVLDAQAANLVAEGSASNAAGTHARVNPALNQTISDDGEVPCHKQ